MEADKLWLKLRVWFQDEARFWRINTPQRCWSPKWHRPVVWKQIVREYTYAYWVVFPKQWDMDSLILPWMRTSIMQIFINELSIRYPNDYMLMIVDWASNHTSGKLKIPKNIKFLPLPPKSPQLNPIESIWHEIREKGFWNKVFNSMNAVEKQLVETLIDLENDKERVSSISWFDWIMEAVNLI